MSIERSTTTPATQFQTRLEPERTASASGAAGISESRLSLWLIDLRNALDETLEFLRADLQRASTPFKDYWMLQEYRLEKKEKEFKSSEEGRVKKASIKLVRLIRATREQIGYLLGRMELVRRLKPRPSAIGEWQQKLTELMGVAKELDEAVQAYQPLQKLRSKKPFHQQWQVFLQALERMIADLHEITLPSTSSAAAAAKTTLSAPATTTSSAPAAIVNSPSISRDAPSVVPTSAISTTTSAAVAASPSAVPSNAAASASASSLPSSQIAVSSSLMLAKLAISTPETLTLEDLQVLFSPPNAQPFLPTFLQKIIWKFDEAKKESLFIELRGLLYIFAIDEVRAEERLFLLSGSSNLSGLAKGDAYKEIKAFYDSLLAIDYQRADSQKAFQVQLHSFEARIKQWHELALQHQDPHKKLAHYLSSLKTIEDSLSTLQKDMARHQKQTVSMQEFLDNLKKVIDAKLKAFHQARYEGEVFNVGVLRKQLQWLQEFLQKELEEVGRAANNILGDYPITVITKLANYYLLLDIELQGISPKQLVRRALGRNFRQGKLILPLLANANTSVPVSTPIVGCGVVELVGRYNNVG